MISSTSAASRSGGQSRVANGCERPTMRVEPRDEGSIMATLSAWRCSQSEAARREISATRCRRTCCSIEGRVERRARMLSVAIRRHRLQTAAHDRVARRRGVRGDGTASTLTPARRAAHHLEGQVEQIADAAPYRLLAPTLGNRVRRLDRHADELGAIREYGEVVVGVLPRLARRVDAERPDRLQAGIASIDPAAIDRRPIRVRPHSDWRASVAADDVVDGCGVSASGDGRAHRSRCSRSASPA